MLVSIVRVLILNWSDVWSNTIWRNMTVYGRSLSLIERRDLSIIILNNLGHGLVHEVLGSILFGSGSIHMLLFVLVVVLLVVMSTTSMVVWMIMSSASSVVSYRYVEVIWILMEHWLHMLRLMWINHLLSVVVMTSRCRVLSWMTMSILLCVHFNVVRLSMLVILIFIVLDRVMLIFLHLLLPGLKCIFSIQRSWNFTTHFLISERGKRANAL